MGWGFAYDFFSYDVGVIDEWMVALIRHCVKVEIYKDYIWKDWMGKGNFATVYAWTKKSDGIKYAVKSIHKKKILESKRKKDINPLLSEIEIMRVLEHQGVIRLYEIYEEETIVHLVLELLEGGELFERIKQKGTYSEKDAMMIMKNILEAISYVHSKGIIHRDLKPENLILKSKDNDYDVKIADFGLASFIKDGEKLNLPCGSPGYVGPEVLDTSFGGYDTKADIFSIGVILYVLLTGWPAFPGANVNDIITKNKIADV